MEFPDRHSAIPPRAGRSQARCHARVARIATRKRPQGHRDTSRPPPGWRGHESQADRHADGTGR